MKKRHLIPVVFALVAMLAFSLSAAAATTVVVTPTNEQGWTSTLPGADTRPGGAVTYTDDTAPPAGGVGSLQLTTNATPTAKAQYMHAANTPLASVTELGYSTYQDSASFAGGDPSYQLVLCLGGVSPLGICTGFTTMVYEPYQNGTVIPDEWQQWDVAAGQFWSSRAYSDGADCVVAAGGGGTPFYTLTDLQDMCPNAVAVGFGVNIGSNNPSYDVRADLVNFNGTVYDFEPYVVATDKDQCKKGGWQTVTDADGNPFKNQGDCVSYVATGGKNN